MPKCIHCGFEYCEVSSRTVCRHTGRLKKALDPSPKAYEPPSDKMVRSPEVSKSNKGNQSRKARS